MSATLEKWHERADAQIAKEAAGREAWRREQGEIVKNHMPLVREAIGWHRKIFGDGFTVLHAMEGGFEAGEKQPEGVPAAANHNPDRPSPRSRGRHGEDARLFEEST